MIETATAGVEASGSGNRRWARPGWSSRSLMFDDSQCHGYHGHGNGHHLRAQRLARVRHFREEGVERADSCTDGLVLNKGGLQQSISMAWRPCPKTRLYQKHMCFGRGAKRRDTVQKQSQGFHMSFFCAWFCCCMFLFVHLCFGEVFLVCCIERGKGCICVLHGFVLHFGEAFCKFFAFCFLHFFIFVLSTGDSMLVHIKLMLQTKEMCLISKWFWYTRRHP